MELLLELGLTVSLSLILTVFFVKLIAMQQPTTTITTDNNKDEVAKLQWMPSQGDSIQLEELKPERKSLVKFHNAGGTFGNQDCDEVEQDDHTDRFESNFDLDEGDGNGGGERRSLEIEIESEDEDEDEDEGEDEGNGEGIESGGESEMSDWEKIERVDYEEIAAFGNGNDDSQVK